ncbi:T9SS type A sorting domain-containing protein [Flavobacteriales bacterium]|nr:T9SS type A sorting domain-containing protein [Flavobacteriales bacterium]
MKNSILILTLLTLFSYNSQATHGVGGDTRFVQTGANNYDLIFKVIRYCSGATAPTSLTNVHIFDNVTEGLITSITASKDSSVNVIIGDACYSPPGLCIEEHYYSASLTLANNPNGYFALWQTCCRNNPLVNVISTGNIWYAQIPDPALTGGNDSPKFSNYPRNGFLCIGKNKNINLSCTDVDGDSLVYSLIQPLADTSASSGVRPFVPTSYSVGGFSLLTNLGPGSICTINSQTGILTARPTQLGLYVIAIKCEEYRNGMKIGEVVRDIQIAALSCYNINISAIGSDLGIISNHSGGTFQWVDCNNGYAVIPGETDSNYVATANGSYAVIIKYGACSDTSNCYVINNVGIEENLIFKNISIYPNPSSSGLFNISLISLIEKEPITISIFDVVGNLIQNKTFYSTQEINANKFDISEATPGIYFVKISNKNTLYTQKIVLAK